MRTYVRTRGYQVDYGFLGSPPEPVWWSEFGRLSAAEYPTLLVHADERGWRAYASAIPTSRQDSHERNIRISLAFAGSPGDESAELVLRLVRSWLTRDTPGASEALYQALEAAFDGLDVERLIADAGPGNDDELEARVGRALSTLDTVSTKGNRPVVPTRAVGGVRDATARAALLSLAEDLLVGGMPGWAVQLNNAGTSAVAERFGVEPHPVLALIESPDGLRDIDSLAAGGGDEDPKALAPVSTPALRVVLVAVVVLLIVIMIVRSRRRNT